MCSPDNVKRQNSSDNPPIMQMLKLHKQLSGQKQPREKSSDFGLMNSDSRQLLAYKQEELLAAQK